MLKTLYVKRSIKNKKKILIANLKDLQFINFLTDEFKTIKNNIKSIGCDILSFKLKNLKIIKNHR